MSTATEVDCKDSLCITGGRNEVVYLTWNTYVALDLETTGLSPMRDQILEIGAARVENGEITGTYETFVDSGAEIPERITDLTGITAEMAAGSPQLREAVEGFLEFSGDAWCCSDTIFRLIMAL